MLFGSDFALNIGTAVDGATRGNGAPGRASPHAAERIRCGFVWRRTIWCRDGAGWSARNRQNTSKDKICIYSL